MYRNCKDTNMPLFKGSTEELNINKKNLITWLQFYSNLNELDQKERPPESIVQEDVLLDRWLEEFFHRKKLDKMAAKRGKHKRDHDEVIKFN